MVSFSIERDIITSVKGDNRNIMSLFVGTLGFICYYIYDFNTIWKPQSLARYLFALGSILVVLSLVLEISNQINDAIIKGWFFLFVFLGLLFCGLLIYTLFFCFDADEAYLQVNHLRQAYTKGMYALCRHPGVIWFILGFFCLYGMFPTKQTLIYVLLMSSYNILYVILQDLFIFPRTFINYGEYKKQAPFLFPNKKSIRECLKTFHKGE